MSQPFLTEEEEIAWCRIAFLETIREMASDVLDDLEAIMPDCQPYLDEQTIWHLHWPEARCEELRSRLRPWAQQHKIDTPWVLTVAAQTLDTWSRLPDWRDKRFWDFASLGWGGPTLEPIWIDLHECSPTEAKQAIDEAALQYQRLGLRYAKMRRPKEHIRWVVRSRICGESYGSIARSVPRSNRSGPHYRRPDGPTSYHTVMKAVKTTADFLGLPQT